MIEDEHGTRWIVNAHDPAKGLVNKLNKAGFVYIVLPRETLVSGTLDKGNRSPEFVRGIRLKDCVGFLEGEDD